MIRAWLAILVAGAGLLAQQVPTVGSPKKGDEKPAATPTPAMSPAKNAPSAAPAARPVSAAIGPSYKDLKYPPLRPMQIPKMNSVTLPNGMRLYLLEDHELPVVNGMALVRTGMLMDPADKVGLADLTLRVMRTGGAGSDPADQLNERLENVAGSVETGATSSSATVLFSSLKESTSEVLAVFKEVLTAPRFNEEKIELARSQMRNGIAHRNDDAGRIAHRELSDLLYGRSTPYGREQEYSTLGNILRSDLRMFHERYFFPKNTMLAIRGDFDPAAMKAEIEKLFADWTVAQPAPPEFPKVKAPPAADATGIFLVNKKDIREAFFAIGQLGGTLNEKDFAALSIMADILGNGEHGRLIRRARTRMGNAPSIWAQWDPQYDFPGIFEISGSSTSLSTVETVKAIQEEVSRIRTSEVSDEELKNAKDASINSLIFGFDTKAKTLTRLMADEYYGYPADFIEQYQKALEAVSRADVLRVAKQYLKPESMATVLVGDAGDFIPPVESLNQAVHKIDLTIPEPALTSARSDPNSMDKGRAMLARLQKAVGGLDKLAAVKDCTVVADYLVDRGGKVTPVRHTELWIAPMHYREDNELGGGTISSYIDGLFGWTTIPGGSVPLTGSALKQVQGNAFRQYQLLLQGDNLPETEVNAVDDQTIEISSEWGQSARVVVDTETGMPLKIRYEEDVRNGPAQLMEETWSDFREVGGIKFPFKVEITQGGRKYADVTVDDFRVNSGLKLTDLEKRR